MLIAVATKNNPQGVASLLSCLIKDYKAEATILISDGSDTPVITDPYVSRLMAAMRVFYRHTTAPHLVEQRLETIETVRDDIPVIWCDDDVIPVGDWRSAYGFCSCDKLFIQGTKVDLYNDRGYKDFNPYSHPKSPNAHRHWDCPADEHGYPMPQVDHSRKSDKEVWYCPDSGLFCCRAGTYRDIARSIMGKASSDTPPSVIDDAIAEYARQKVSYILHHGLKGLHVGNSNRHWSADSQKREAVLRLIK